MKQARAKAFNSYKIRNSMIQSRKCQLWRVPSIPVGVTVAHQPRVRLTLTASQQMAITANTPQLPTPNNPSPTHTPINNYICMQAFVNHSNFYHPRIRVSRYINLGEMSTFHIARYLMHRTWGECALPMCYPSIQMQNVN